MNSPLQKLNSEFLMRKEINLFVKRDDLIHPFISGNKWRKLKYNLDEIKSKGYKRIISFGGAYSNHIHALSYACKINEIEFIGVIRGEECEKNPSKTLIDSMEFGMKPYYISRSQYKERYSKEYQNELLNKFKADFIVPEGGSNDLALLGVTELLNEIDIDFDFITMACGTAGTISGVIKGLSKNQKAIGVSALKGDFHSEEIRGFIGMSYEDKYEVFTNYHFGGYAKTKPELMDFIIAFEKEYNIKLEQVYTGKMFYALFDLIEKDYFKKGSNIVAIHTGGLQGRNF